MNRALENLMGIMGMGTKKKFLGNWKKGTGKKIFFREWESEKVVPAGHYLAHLSPPVATPLLLNNRK